MTPPAGAAGSKPSRDLAPGDRIYIGPIDGGWWTPDLERRAVAHGWRTIEACGRTSSGIVWIECSDGVAVDGASPHRKVWIGA